ncbi:MAG: RagB/SusD family nutrient uptake outer membrane protein, partial [Bacteroidota bacterium]
LYWEKVREFGDVPFYNEPIDSEDHEALYQARDSRVMVVDSIVADLDYAIANLGEEDNKVEVNKWTALALKSRICLAAASTFDYHNIPGSDPASLYQASYDASKEIMDNGPFALHSNYTDIFANEELSGNVEAILVKQYNENMKHAIHSFIFHEPFFGFTLSSVSSFLMADGKPISYDGATHPDYTEWVFKTDKEIKTAFTSYDTLVDITTNRDKRMSAIIDTTRLVFLFNKGVPMYSPAKYATYQLIKSQPTQGVEATTDAPVIRYGEILLNYAEAAFELGTITQGDLDNSINLLRDRAGIAHLTVDVGFDADDIDPTVDPLLWEIRRERRIELMLEPFRKWDLIRWKNGLYFNDDKAFVGVKDDPNNNYQAAANIIRNADGYLYTHAEINRREAFDESKNYLNPIPADQITLNENLIQTEGW